LEENGEPVPHQRTTRNLSSSELAAWRGACVNSTVVGMAARVPACSARIKTAIGITIDDFLSIALQADNESVCAQLKAEQTGVLWLSK